MAPDKKKSSSCSKVGKVQKFLDELLSEDERRSFSVHLSKCQFCSKELESILKVRTALRLAVDEPLAELDKDALFARIRTKSLQRKKGQLAWRLAFGTAFFLVLIISWVALRSDDSLPSSSAAKNPEVASPSETPLPERIHPVHTLGPALVTYIGGKVDGPEKQNAEWTVPLGKALQVGEASGLALRLDEKTSVVVLGKSSVRLAWAERWELKLDRGIVAVRLDKPRNTGFRVVCPAGIVDAIGTSFSVERLDDKSCSVVLEEGRLSLSNSAGQHFELKAPIRRVLSGSGLGKGSGNGTRSTALEFARLLDPGSRQALGELDIVSSPQGAIVAINGTDIGHSPLMLARPRKALELSFRADGFLPESIRVVPKPGLRIEKNVILKPVFSDHTHESFDLVAKARELLAKRKVVLARSILERHLLNHPDDPRSLILLADAYRMASDPEKSLDTYLKVAALSSDENLCEAAMYHAGLLRLNDLNRPLKALETFRSIARQFPKGLLRQEVAFCVAESYLAIRDYRRALRSLRDYIRLYPDGTRVDDARALLKKMEDAGWR